MKRKRSAFALQICMLFVVCDLSATVGSALRRSSGSVGDTDRRLAIPQSDEKVIERQRDQNEPFEICDLSLQATNILLGEKFDVRTLPESRDWLKDLQFAIKNKSDKQITYFIYSLRFPQALINGGQLLNPMDVGVPPAPLRSITDNKPLVINPEDTFKVALSDKELTLINKVLSREGLNLSRCKIPVLVLDL